MIEINKNIPTIEKIFNKLNLMERGALFKYCNDEAHIKMLQIAHELDDCILAALVENFPSMSYKEIDNIANDISVLRVDQEKKLEQMKNYSNEEINKMSKDIADRCCELIIEGKNQASSIKVLTKEFPNMPKATIVKAYKLSKENVNINPDVINATTDKEINEMVDYIMESKPKSKFKVYQLSVEGERCNYVIDIANKTINAVDVDTNIKEADTEIERLNKEIELLNKKRVELELGLQEFKAIAKEFLNE